MDQLKNLNKAFIGLLKKKYSAGLDGKEESYKIIRTKTAGYLYVDTIYDIDYSTYTEINNSSSYQNYFSFSYKDIYESEQNDAQSSSANKWPNYTSTSSKKNWPDFTVPHIAYSLYVERGCRFIPIMYPENDEDFLKKLNIGSCWGDNHCYALEANRIYIIPNIKISSGYKAIDVMFTIKTSDFDKRMAEKKRNKKKRLEQKFGTVDDEMTEGPNLLWTYE